MGRRAKPAKVRAKAKRPLVRKAPTNGAARVHELEKRLAESREREKATGALLQEKNRALTEAQAQNTETREQQTATSEILRVIAGSPTDVQPVFAAVAASAARLCDAFDATIFQIDGERLRVAVHDGPIASHPVGQGPSLVRETPSGRAVLDRRTIHVTDAQAETDKYPEGSEHARRLGFRTVLAVPLMREELAIGVINLHRAEAQLFTERQVALLETFADQAVIAIENVRLFTELQASNRELTTTLDQQTATAEILQVISSSPTDAQPVFDALVRAAVRLCHAVQSNVQLFDGQLMHYVAQHNIAPAAMETVHQLYPMPLNRSQTASRAVLDRAVIHVPDVLDDPEYLRELAVKGGWRSVLSVPMIGKGRPIGAITVTRMEPGLFSETEIALLQTFADQAVIAIENVRLFTELQASNRELTTALDTQTATSDILRVISRSQTDVQPVFDAIVTSAVRLLHGYSSVLTRIAGDQIVLAALTSTDEVGDGIVRAHFPQSLHSDGEHALAIRSRVPLNIAETDIDARISNAGRAMAEARGIRSLIVVPMLHHDEAVGTIVVTRREPGGFNDGESALLQTFADQAVIAIENVRLFTELQQKNEALTQAHAQVTEALEQQTATSEILKVIASSPTDIEPVLDALVKSATRFCGAYDAIILLSEGDSLRLGAHHGPIPNPIGLLVPAVPGTAAGRALLERRVFQVADLPAEVDEFPEGSAIARQYGYRTILSVPLLRENAAIGVIQLRRAEVNPFSDKQIALLQTFADQAVIAIENVRLFTELEGRNRDLTATGEILRVISSSPTDVQPVFDTIVRSAVRLCDGLFSGLLQFDGELIQHVAEHNFTPEALEEVRRIFPARPTRALYSGRAILERAVVHIPDVDVDDPEYQHHAVTHAIGWRSGLWVPMLREGAPIGVIMVARAVAGPFSDNEVELLKTFADQAVIAVENVRLFKELQARTGELTQSVEKLTALGEVSRAVSSTLDVETVLNTIVSRASQLAGGAGCAIYEYDEAAEQFELRATHNFDSGFAEALRAAPLRKGEGLMGRAAETGEPIQVPDISQPGAYQSSVRDTLIRFGYRAILSVPLLREEQIIGSLTLTRKAPGEYPPEVIEVLKTFATQSALAIQNARLFREIADKSAQLEVASQHKSEFLANMSHELRTPLNAIIGFSEVLVDRMFGELNEKQDEYLKDIYASGQHLLSLINDILDLSKIEAGRMELEATDFDLPSAIDNALILVRERATRRGITLGHSVDERLGPIRGDERKVKQVLLNLLSNALKFTPEGGRIDVGAGVHDGVAEIAVTDTGVGIAPEDQEAVFEEFRQVGAADKKVEGTGLGLALSRKFIELHGGRIWVKSQVGQGSTFTFTLPVRREE